MTTRIFAKKVKFSPDFSRDALAFSAEIWYNGAKVGTLSNDGQGGPDALDVAQYVIEEMATELGSAEALGEWFDDQIDEAWNVFAEAQAAKKLNAKCKTTTFFRLVGDQPGAWRTVRAPFSQGVTLYLDGKYGAGKYTVYTPGKTNAYGEP